MNFGILLNGDLVGEIQAKNREAARQSVVEKYDDIKSLDHLDELGIEFVEIVVSTVKPKMMPMKKGTCVQCGVVHEPDAPHNWQSISYQIRFKLEHDRDATVADAFAHCPPDVVSIWKDKLAEFEIGQAGWHGWTEPSEGIEPIAEPHAVA